MTSVVRPAGIRADLTSATSSVALVQTDVASGTAFVVGPDVLVTNAHVVQGANEVSVAFPDGSEVTCDVTREDDAADLASLRCDTTGHAALRLAAREPDIGADVTIVGYPGGAGPVVTRGVLSSDIAGDPYLRTDAAANPGNSGGPLLRGDGTVVGLVTAVDRVESDATYAIRVDALRQFLGDPTTRQATTPTTMVRTASATDVHDHPQVIPATALILLTVIGMLLVGRTVDRRSRRVPASPPEVHLVPDVPVRLLPGGSARASGPHTTPRR